MAMRVPSRDIATDSPEKSFTASPLMSDPIWLIVIAVGVLVIAFEAVESPTSFTALMVTEYVVLFVRPLIVNGLDVVAGFSAT